MDALDDELLAFEAHGAPPLPRDGHERYVDHDGARIWCASYGSGPPVVLLHGGLGHSGNWGHQVPALLESGRRVVLIDSRGHGRSTRDDRPFTYERMAADAVAVLDAFGVAAAPLIGWSDGACTALIVAMHAADRVEGVLFFGCNMDPSGTKDLEPSAVVDRCFARHAKDYAALSATPDEFDAFVRDVGAMMATQPNYTAAELAAIRVPVTIAHSEHDEFIRREHAEYLARTIPRAELVVLPGVSHFAPLQRPAQFNAMALGFLDGLGARARAGELPGPSPV
jgi:pimeloyl-ACP methyl ester carboxylesterase